MEAYKPLRAELSHGDSHASAQRAQTRAQEQRLAARYGVPHRLSEEHPFFVKAVTLIAIPGESSSAAGGKFELAALKKKESEPAHVGRAGVQAGNARPRQQQSRAGLDSRRAC